MIVVDVRELGIPHGTAPFAQGAVGELFRVPKPVPSLPGRTLVFKRLKANGLPIDRTRILAQMRSVVAMRDGMDAADRADLDDVAVWPLAMVRDGAQDVGILIDLIAPEFFVATKPPTGPAGKLLFELQFLCVGDDYLDRVGIDRAVAADDVMRLALAARLAYAIEVVHRRPVVFGDLHGKNAVAATAPYARVMLMDCDSVAELSDTSRIQMHGPFFTPPEIAARRQRLQDQVTDVYKLGLCIIRALSPGHGATQAKDPTRTKPGLLDPEGVQLLSRAVSDERADRPMAWELRDYLVRRVRGLVQPPELLSAELERSVVLRGSDVLVRWRHRHGTEVRIFGTNGFTVEGIDPDRHGTGFAIRPPAAGPIDVEVWNRYGPSARVRAGHLDYYELPELDIAGQLRGMPRPVVPGVPALDVKAFDALRPYPTAAQPDLAISVRAPALGYPAVMIDPGRGALGTRFGTGPTAATQRAQRAANRIVGRTVTDGMRRMTRVVRDHLDNTPQPHDP